MPRRYISDQERNLTILTRTAWWGILVTVAFASWWLYQGVGFFKDEMSFQDVFGARRGPHLPLPAGTVASDGYGFDPAQLLPPGAPLPPPPPPDVALGRRLYHDNCSFCHAMSGRGDAPVGLEYDPRPGDLNRSVPRLNDRTLFDQISDGIPAGPGIDTSPPLTSEWHAFRFYLDADERWQIVNFLRAGFGRARAATPPGATTILHPEYHIVGNPAAPPRRHH